MHHNHVFIKPYCRYIKFAKHTLSNKFGTVTCNIALNIMCMEEFYYLQTSLLRIAQVQIVMMGLIMIVKTWLVNGGYYTKQIQLATVSKENSQSQSVCYMHNNIILF